MAVARAAAASARQPLYRYLAPQARVLPVPMVNVINGGAHAPNTLDFQEFMLVPGGAPTFREAVRWSAEVFHLLKAHLKAGGHPTAVGDEGGYAPDFKVPEEALDALVKDRRQASAWPVVASRWTWLPGTLGRGSTLQEGWREAFPRRHDRRLPWLVTPIDRLARTGCRSTGWMEGLTERLARESSWLDDVFVTNPAIIREGIARGIANAVLIKLNQIGTVTETLEAIRLSHEAGWRTVVSHRSGETEDTFIADFSVAAGSGHIKTGSVARSERVAKYNQLMRIEEELGAEARYAGTGR